jgi:hypothetical protein
MPWLYNNTKGSPLLATLMYLVFNVAVTPLTMRLEMQTLALAWLHPCAGRSTRRRAGESVAAVWKGDKVQWKGSLYRELAEITESQRQVLIWDN